MARDFSEEYVRSLRFPNLPLLHLAIQARPLIRGIRSVRRLTSPPTSPANDDPRATPEGDQVSTSFDDATAHFRSKQWAFVDPFFTGSLHERLVQGWPDRRFLEPPSDVVKSYDRGFEWRRYHRQDPPYLDRHPALQEAFAQLRSDRFARRVSAFAGGTRDLACYSLIVTSTVPGSNVAPHRDSTAYTPEGEHFLNIVIFVDGSGGTRSGGLAILGDNTFDQTIFESRKLRNTALVYATAAPFYHGFEPVEWGKFRWALLAQFCDRGYVGHAQ